MFEEVINKFIKQNNSKIKLNKNKENIVLFDRSLHDQVIRGSLSALAFNELFDYKPIVITDKSKNDWQTRIYKSFGIENL